MADGRIVADVGETRKRRLKAFLGLKGISMTDWLKKIIDKYLDENNN